MRKLKPEEKSFIDKLYIEQYRSLFDYAKRFLEDSSAQEAVQDAFRDACLKIDDIMASKNPVGWLVNALKFSIGKIKRQKAQFARTIVLMPACSDNNIDNDSGCTEISIDEIPDPDPPDEDVDFLYSDLSLHKEFQLIKEYAVDDKSIKEIADEQGISIKACKQKLYRCRLKLRKLWDKQNKKT